MDNKYWNIVDATVKDLQKRSLEFIEPNQLDFISVNNIPTSSYAAYNAETQQYMVRIYMDCTPEQYTFWKLKYD